ncbi:hypothetical protein [Streptomyces roseolus]|uniref:hypothetical protein n=1 Tax=Streptomyces roseolus TaxID=67358 RepID=UPI0016734532|nr:hypothetical protein [Streptomyces roseolus]
MWDEHRSATTTFAGAAPQDTATTARSGPPGDAVAAPGGAAGRSSVGVPVAEAGAAVWATRDDAPLRLVRGLAAVLGCGLPGALVWITLVKALTSCLPGGTPCGPLPDAGGLRVAVLAMTLTAVPAWSAFAALDTLTTASRRRPLPPVPGPLHRPW